MAVGDDQLSYAVLGPLTAWHSGQEIGLGWAKLKAVLVVLLLEMNRPVPVTRIIDAVWGEHPPREVRNTVQTSISRLRRALQPDRAADGRSSVLILTDAGYVLHGDPTHLDLNAFELHLAAAEQHHSQGELRAASEQLDAAPDAVARGTLQRSRRPADPGRTTATTREASHRPGTARLGPPRQRLPCRRRRRTDSAGQ